MQNNKAQQKYMWWQLVAMEYLFMANLRAPEGLSYICFFTRLGMSHSYNEGQAVYELRQIN